MAARPAGRNLRQGHEERRPPVGAEGRIAAVRGGASEQGRRANEPSGWSNHEARASGGCRVFLAGVVFFVVDNNSMGSSMVAMGVVFSVIAKQQSDVERRESDRD